MKIDLKKVSGCLALSAALALTACNTGYAAEQMSQALPIQNSGFEDGLTGWGVGAEFKDQVSLEKATVHGGAQALEIDATTKNNTPFVTYGAKAVGGSVYAFSVWARVAPRFARGAGRLKDGKLQRHSQQCGVVCLCESS